MPQTHTREMLDILTTEQLRADPNGDLSWLLNTACIEIAPATPDVPQDAPPDVAESRTVEMTLDGHPFPNLHVWCILTLPTVPLCIP